MAEDTKYSSKPWIFQSKGLMARPATDRAPDDHYYLNQDGGFEREESAMSTRWGSAIVNRDPVGAVTTNNYFLPAAPVVLARLRALNGNTYRYAALADGTLWRRAGDTQGPYTQIASGLSGKRFSWQVLTCFGSATPYVFFYDPVNPLKDNGTGSPTSIGIAPPVVPITATQYAPVTLPIDTFQSASGYGESGTLSTAATVAATSPSIILSGNYTQYVDLTLSYAAAPDGMIALSTNLPDGAIRLKFNTNRNDNTYDIVALNNAYSPTDSFAFKQVAFSFPSNATTSIGKTVALNLGKYQASDLIVLVMSVGSPANVSQITVQFDVNGSGYTSSYYTKSVVPVSYQGNLSLPQVNDPTSAVVNEVFDLATGITNIQQLGQASNLPGNDPNIPLIQPSQMSDGEGSWSVVYLQLGDFLPVGDAGNPGADWSAVTGWQVQVVTTSQGSTDIAFNGLYVQGSPTSSGVGTNAGPSSYGGVGYDLRYTYWDNNTFTESNPCAEAMFSVTQANPGGESTLVVLRQAINASGQYSANPRVTHVRVYVRGGLYGQNWYYADQFPNVTGGGTFNYDYILPDTVLQQGNILNLQNDVPVTSTLQVPINTTLTNALTPSPVNTNTPTLVVVDTANASADFLAGQIVVIGTPQNLEECYVVASGTGAFTCYVFLPHAIGEPVQAFSQPAIACNLAASGYGQTWLAGDPNNPHLLYYTPNSYPENCPPQSYIPSPGGPSDPISAVINFRGTIFVRTYSTWYQVFPGSPPYMQSTGSKHGSPASFDWSITESEIFFQAFDGIRTFRGSDGDYKSLIIEWLYRNIGAPLTPVTDVNLNLLGNVVSAFKNNTVTFAYTGVDGLQHRLRWSQTYKRWRNDDVPATAMLVEQDTNQFLYSVPITAGGQSGWVIVYEDITKDYDDGGWVNGVLVQTPIALNLQTPFIDQEMPNNQKDFNMLTLDINPNGQTISPLLLFDDNNGSVAPVVPQPATITGSVRSKFNFQINEGLGQQAYRMSLQITAAVISAPIIYQADIYHAVLADQLSSWDSYWKAFSSNQSKLLKQIYIDITSTATVDVQVFSDGNTVPYYSFSIPANPTRYETPTRFRLPAIKLRLFRLVMLTDGMMQIWNPVQCDVKDICIGKGYQRAELSQS